MVDNENNYMSADDFDQLISDNPPGTAPADPAPQTQTTETDPAPAAQQPQNTAPNTEPNNTAGETDPQADGTGGDAGSKHDANQAFANMRVTNRKMQNALAAVLQQHGLDPALANDPDRLIQDAENARLEEEAKKQKVPTELLKRLTQLEQANLENQQKRLTETALAGFQAIKTKYNLDNKDISAFAKQLQDAGTNPFEQEMDLDLHYRLHNLDKIIAAESQKAVEAALRNQTAARQHSTTPSTVQGKESTGTEQIDTMAKFDRFIQSLK
jgi:hypothetical protein